MENTSADALALRLLEQCLRGESYSPEIVDELIRRDSPALFRVVAEGLSDRFEPGLSETYSILFSDVIARVLGVGTPAELLARRRALAAGPCRVSARTVFVLSRVTLGADVAITSILLAAAKQRFPDADIRFVGPRKNFELFAADPRLSLAEIGYPRSGGLRERLGAYERLAPLLSAPDSIVIDPDSRLSQLGLLPLGVPERYFFFDSRSSGGEGTETLAELTRRWAMETFSVSNVSAYLAPAAAGPEADIAVSLGVGENPAKRLSAEFERALLAEIARRGGRVLVDRGGSEEEARRVDAAIAGLANVTTWNGAFAPFAAAITRAKAYCGYDSAGQHVAAASGVPLLAVFAGHPSLRMFQRWRPDGPGPKQVVRVEGQPEAEVLASCHAALDLLRAYNGAL